MNQYDGCMATIRAAAGRNLSDDEMTSLLEALQARERIIRNRSQKLGGREPALQAADDLAAEMHLQATVEKRNAALNLAIRQEKVAWIQRNFGRNAAEGLEALLVGVNRAKEGARAGAAQIQESLKGTYLGGFVADLEKSGHLSLLTTGAMDRDVARALWAIGKGDDEAALAGMSREAVDVAQVIHKWQEVSRHDANDAGAWIRQAEGYITRQSHDPQRIRGDGSQAAYETWRDAAIKYFDLERLGSDNPSEPPGAVLRTLWTDFSTGRHMKVDPELDEDGFKGPASLAKKLSQSRVVYFKDADAWHDYNQLFGMSNLRESVVKTLQHHADSTGLMRTLGTNPKAMFDTIKKDLVKGLTASDDVSQIAKMASKEGRLANFMAAIDGTMSIPGSALWARRMANVRSWEMLSKLGGMLLSQLNDIVVYGAGTRYQGRGFFTGITESLGGLGRNLGNPETRQLAESLGIVLDDAAGALGRVGAFGEAGGMAKATQLFMKLNLGHWWTNHMRSSAALGLSNHLASEAGRAFDSLAPDFQRLLSTYGITPEKWDVIRATAAKNVDGKAYLVPEHVQALGDDKVAGLAERAGVTPDAMRKEISGNLQNYLTDQTSFLALEPDKKTRAVLLQGTRPGTVNGELMRFLMQFKSFTGAYMQKIMGRELYGRGYEGDSVWGALTHGNGEAVGLAQLIVTSTLMGYGSMVLKDLAKGKSPRDPTESKGQAAQILAAALTQGGGAGIYGDFLFGAASRMGSGTIESLAGPTISTGGRIVDLYHRALAGDDFAARAFNEGLNNTPFVNLFYTRAALNYLIFYRMQEMMNPGYLRRMERQTEKDNAQTFLIRPSSVVH